MRKIAQTLCRRDCYNLRKCWNLERCRSADILYVSKNASMSLQKSASIQPRTSPPTFVTRSLDLTIKHPRSLVLLQALEQTMSDASTGPASCFYKANHRKCMKVTKVSTARDDRRLHDCSCCLVSAWLLLVFLDGLFAIADIALHHRPTHWPIKKGFYDMLVASRNPGMSKLARNKLGGLVLSKPHVCKQMFVVQRCSKSARFKHFRTALNSYVLQHVLHLFNKVLTRSWLNSRKTATEMVAKC